MLVFVAGLLAIIAMLILRVKGAILIGIVGATILAIILEAIFKVGSQTDATGQVVNPSGWGLNVPTWPSTVVEIPDFGLLGQFSLLGSFSKIGFVAAALLIFTLMLADFFDTMGTMVAIGAEAGLLDEDGNPPNSQRILLDYRCGCWLGWPGRRLNPEPRLCSVTPVSPATKPAPKLPNSDWMNEITLPSPSAAVM